MDSRVKRLNNNEHDVVIFDTFKSKLFRWFQGWRYKSENKDYIYFYNKHNSKMIGFEEKLINSNHMLSSSFTNESI